MDEAVQLTAWLDRLAAGTPAPGGGAVAALSAAMGAGLVAMTCRVTAAKTQDAVDELAGIVAEADRLRGSALTLMDADGEAYGAVIAARRLPKTSGDEQRTRTGAIDEALIGAAEVPLSVARHAAAVIDLAGRVRPVALRSTLADLEAGVMSARTALLISLLNARTNLDAISDRQRGEILRDELAALEDWSG